MREGRERERDRKRERGRGRGREKRSEREGRVERVRERERCNKRDGIYLITHSFFNQRTSIDIGSCCNMNVIFLAFTT